MLRFVLLTAILPLSTSTTMDQEPPSTRGFSIQVVEGGWGDARVRAIEELLHSTASELLRYFPHRKKSAIIVQHSKEGPRTLYRKGPAGETIVLLNTTSTYWAQYSFQFSHELAHILCKYDLEKNPNTWFEEAICETASLFTLKRMARTWRSSPPRSGWRSFAPSLKKYVRERIQEMELPSGINLSRWYRQNEEELRRDPFLRKKNGAVACCLLPFFERNPEHWEALSYLNSGKSRSGQSFSEYLGDWYQHCPSRHKEFVKQISRLFGVALEL